MFSWPHVGAPPLRNASICTYSSLGAIFVSSFFADIRSCGAPTKLYVYLHPALADFLEGRKEDYTSLQPPRADWMDWQHPNNQNNPSQNVQHQQCPTAT